MLSPTYSTEELRRVSTAPDSRENNQNDSGKEYVREPRIEQGTSSHGQEDILQVQKCGLPSRRHTIHCPLMHLSSSEDGVLLKEVERVQKSAFADPISCQINSSYPEQELTENRLSGENSGIMSEAEVDLNEKQEQEVVGVPLSISPVGLEPADEPQSDSLENPKIRKNQIKSPKQTSAWTEGEQLIDCFGYVSAEGNGELPISPSKPYSILAPANVSEVTTLRPLSTSQSVLHLTSRGFGYTTTDDRLEYSAASVAAISSKRGSFSKTWNYDHDGSDNDSPRTARTDFSFSRLTDKGNTPTPKWPTKSLISSNHVHPDSSPKSESKGKKGFTQSKWFLRSNILFILVLMVYAIIITVKVFSRNPLSDKEVGNYFEGLNSTQRQLKYKDLIVQNDSGHDSSSNVSKNLSTTTNKTHNGIFMNPSNPNDNLVGLGSENSFSGINPKYHGDYEIRELMEDSRLFDVFYGLAYAPRGVIEPMCGASKREVLLDMALLSRVTSRVRTYGTQCQQAELALEAIQELNLNMTLALGIWIGPDNYVNWKQLNDMKSVLNKFPRKYFDSIFIGNEVMFRSDKSVLELMEYVDEARMFTNSIGYGDIPIGTSELGSQIKEEMISNCDFVGANIHPFFGGEDVKIATRWTLDFVTGQVVPFMSKIKENVDLVISEVGWPSGGGRFMEANAGTAELQDFLETWVCQMQEMNLKWFYFEAFDEPWKKIWHTEESKWETQWGVFTQDRKLKEGIVLPSCKGRTVLIS